MKLFLLLTAAIAMHSTVAMAAELGPGCSAEQARINAQIADAKARNQTHRLKGLARALQATTDNCTEESLEKEKKEDIQEARQELAEREAELREAEKSGDTKKLEKRRAQVEEARRELAEAEAE